jgi:Flp pilus assembly protein TadG
MFATFALSICKAWRRCWRGERGVAALELGLMTPFLVLSLVAVVELGTAAYEAMQVQNAAQVGAIYAAHNDYNTSAIQAAVENATGNDEISATVTQFCACPSAGGLVTTDCDSTCDEDDTPGQYVQVSAEFTHEPLLSFPGFSVPDTLTGTAIVRVE